MIDQRRTLSVFAPFNIAATTEKRALGAFSAFVYTDAVHRITGHTHLDTNQLETLDISEIQSARQELAQRWSDVSNAPYQAWGGLVDGLIHFLENDPAASEALSQIRSDNPVDFDKWYSDFQSTGGSFVGSKRYEIPATLNEQASLFYELLKHFDEGVSPKRFCVDAYGLKNYQEMCDMLSSQIVHPVVRAVDTKLKEAGTHTSMTTSTPPEQDAPDPRKVFVVHGRDERLRKDFFAFLRSIGLHPLEWSQAIALTGSASPYIGEVLERAFAEAQAVVVLLSPDDEAKLKDAYIKESDPVHERELMGQARPNVLFEAGMAFGSHPKRTVMAEVGALRPFSDVAGRHTVRLDNSANARLEIANRLENAGCDVNKSGQDWLEVGDLQL